MNFYVVVEGRRTEPRLYRSWLPLLRPGLSEVERLEDAVDEHFYLVAGMGYPSYLTRIQAAVQDLQQTAAPFCLVVAVDAEEQPAAARVAEIEAQIEAAGGAPRQLVVVADCCIESWLLGNRRLIKRNPSSAVLRGYLAFYNVAKEDPEAMDRPAAWGQASRASFHLDYLQEAFRERGLSFTKKHPGDAATAPYLAALQQRVTETQAQGDPHLASFARLLRIAAVA